MKRQQPEAVLQKAVASYLRAALPAGWRFFHVPNGGRRDPRTGAALKADGVRRGVPDIIVTGPSRTLIAFELKAGKGRISDEQADWLMHLHHDCGFDAWIVRSVFEVDSLLWQAGCKLKARVTL